MRNQVAADTKAAFLPPSLPLKDRKTQSQKFLPAESLPGGAHAVVLTRRQSVRNQEGRTQTTLSVLLNAFPEETNFLLSIVDTTMMKPVAAFSKRPWG